jgi:hypothetical protein
MTAAERERYQRRYGLSPKKVHATTTETQMQTQREQGRIKSINTERRFLFKPETMALTYLHIAASAATNSMSWAALTESNTWSVLRKSILG